MPVERIGDRGEESGLTMKKVSLFVTAADSGAGPSIRGGQVALDGASVEIDPFSTSSGRAGEKIHDTASRMQARAAHVVQ